MNPHVEKELHFAFPDSVQWEKFDKEGLKLPVGIKLVDLVIERDTDILLVEIKDPSDTGAVADKKNIKLI